LDGQVLTEIENRICAFQAEIRKLLEQKNNGAVFPVQEKLNAVWDVVSTSGTLPAELQAHIHIFA